LKLQDLYKLAVELGKNADPRGKKELEQTAARLKADFNELKDKDKAKFDQEKLFNPYSDTRILFGDTGTNVTTIMAGIDIDVGELLLADKLNQGGAKIDLVVSHHPSGKAYANFYEVMHMQADILSNYGVPINVAEGIMDSRIKEVERRVMPNNHTRAVDAAKLLDICFMCIHTAADNHVVTFLQKLMDDKKPQRVQDVISLLEEIPEYQEAGKNNNPPRIITGDSKKRAGKVFVDMTGGTEGSIEAMEKLSQAGVGTIVGMHMSEDHRKNAEKFHINVVIAGHISSDNLGLNLVFDGIQKKEPKLKVIECSGFRRFKRSGK
jgi:hypothetical protein